MTNRRTDTVSDLDEATVQRDKLAMLGQLTAGIAHDLNNPIGFIASNINSLERYVKILVRLVEGADDLLDGPRRQAWENALEEANWAFIKDDVDPLIDDTRTGTEHLKAVVADLKNLSRASDSVEHISVDDCIRSAMSVMAYHFKHGVEVEVQPEAPRPIAIVRSQIIQMLTNLLHNSVQIFEGQPGTIALHSHQTDDATVLTVEDSGPGIPEHIAERIFAPFFTTKSPGFGTGLGLSIVRRIARDHHGEVTYDRSERLGGARFTIRLKGRPE